MAHVKRMADVVFSLFSEYEIQFILCFNSCYRKFYLRGRLKSQVLVSAGTHVSEKLIYTRTQFSLCVMEKVMVAKVVVVVLWQKPRNLITSSKNNNNNNTK